MPLPSENDVYAQLTKRGYVVVESCVPGKPWSICRYDAGTGDVTSGALCRFTPSSTDRVKIEREVRKWAGNFLTDLKASSEKVASSRAEGGAIPSFESGRHRKAK